MLPSSLEIQRAVEGMTSMTNHVAIVCWRMGHDVLLCRTQPCWWPEGEWRGW